MGTLNTEIRATALELQQAVDAIVENINALNQINFIDTNNATVVLPKEIVAQSILSFRVC